MADKASVNADHHGGSELIDSVGSMTLEGSRGSIRRLALLLILVLTGALAACGGETSNGNSGTAEQNAENGETTGQGMQPGATTLASGDVWSYELPGKEVYPEGVVYQESSGDFFASSTSDGAIFRGTVEEGGGNAGIFLEGGQDERSTAVGLALDGEEHLFVAGGETGRMFVYDTGSGELVERIQNGRESTFVNDVIVAPSGDAYFTDSFSPVIYRLAVTGEGFEFEEYLDLEGTPIEYQDDFNLNGIVATPDGRYLIVTHSTTGQLFRIDTKSKEVVEIDLGGERVAGDGMLLDGLMLYAVVGGEILPVRLSEDYASGEVGDGFSYSQFRSPTTIAGYEGRLLVVNSQFDAQESGDPELPFTVSDVPIP